jgi:hypothetical protein
MKIDQDHEQSVTSMAPDDLVPLCKYFRVHWLWKQSISKEMNNDNFEFA